MGTMLCLLIVTLSATAARADEPAISNMDLMNKLTGEVVTDLMGRMGPSLASTEVVLVPSSLDERYEFIDNVFTRILTEQGFRVLKAARAPGDTTLMVGGSAFQIEYQATGFNLVYPKIYRSHLIGGRTVERTAAVRIIAKVVDPADDSIVWVGDAGSSHADKFAYADLAAVEVGLFTFSKPPRESTNWAKIAEPVVVSGIIVGLIYLFFSNQTSE